MATRVNHAPAGWLGGGIAGLIGPQLPRWVIGGGFLAMAVWMMVPDRLDEAEAAGGGQRFGISGTTRLAYFLAEMGDKTQIATVALVHGVAAAIFAVLGLLTLFNVAQLL